MSSETSPRSRILDASTHGEDLPAYSTSQSPPRRPRRQTTLTAPQEPVMHVCHLPDKTGHAWLRLQCSSRSKRPEEIPRVLEGDKLDGSVEMDLPDWKTIKAIRVSVIGELILEESDRFPFLQLTHELWSSSSTPILPSTSGMFQKGKLRGFWSWPFSFSLPETVEVKKSRYRLPSSFNSRQTYCTILYRLAATVVSGMFTPDYSLETHISYLPMIKPDAPSHLRQMAYQQNLPLVEPDRDPEGWHSLAPQAFSGTLFGERAVEISYTLSLAKPLCYTRGTVIPLFLTVKSEDSQALDVFSTSNAPVVRLRRVILLGNVGSAAPGVSGSKNANRASTSRSMQIPARTILSHLQFSTWWRSSNDNEGGDGTTRILQGEIHLPGALYPSAYIARYLLSYDVALYSPNAVGFSSPSSSTKSPVQTIPVEIATAPTNGPVPIKYAPPKYDDPAEAVEEGPA